MCGEGRLIFRFKGDVNMSRIEIEFFHDVICSFCFPMSYRMRQFQNLMPDVHIKHRSFALVRAEQDFIDMFGSREAAKTEILSHWEHANQNDDLHRFQIEGMRKAIFPFPSSMNVLVACKAAYFVAGDAGYWDAFDALQKALFVESQNIEEEGVIFQCLREINIDFKKWKKYYYDPKSLEAVEEDLLLAESYRIESVPCLIINKTHKLSGALPLKDIINAVNKAAGASKEEEISEGAACKLEDGKFHCD